MRIVLAIITAGLISGCITPPDPKPDPHVDPDEKAHNFSNSAPITDRIVFNKITESNIYYTGTRNWGTQELTGECHLYVVRDGQWVGGKFDHVRNNTQQRDFNNIYNGYQVWSHIHPIKGETVAFMLIAYDKSKRTNAVFPKWQGKSTPPTPPSGNNPNISDPTKIPSGWSHNTARNYGAGKAKPNQYHGVVKCESHDQATNLRYALRMHFEWDLNVFTAYPTPERPGTGWVNIWVQDSDNTTRWTTNP